MREERKTDRMTSRLISIVAAAEERDQRQEALAGFITAHSPDEIASAMAGVSEAACRRADAGLAFLSLLDIGALRQRTPEWDWQGLDRALEETDPGLADALSRVSGLGRDAIRTVTAKAALLIEIGYILGEEILHGSSEENLEEGAALLGRVLGGGSPTGTRLKVRLSQYPVGCRKSLREILSELDFIEQGDGSWQYTLSQKVLDNLAEGSSLASHRESTEVSMALASRNAESLVRRLELLTRTMQMFPSGHPSIRPTITSFLGILSKFLTARGQVTLTVEGDTVMVNDVRIRRKTKPVEEFVRTLIDRQINSMTFGEGVTMNDVRSFAEVFNKPPAYISSHGGFAKLLESRGLETVTVNRFHYELISGEEDEAGERDALDRQETALEDAIFSELIGRLERGESLESMSSSNIGEALKTVLDAADESRSGRRGMLARFIAALDPTLLEKGLLASEHVQRGMAWSAVRKIIEKHLEELGSTDPDVRHEAAESLQDMARMAVERGKDNTVLQIIDDLAASIERETDPDVLYRLVSLTGAILRVLMAHGMISIAVRCARIITRLGSRSFDSELLESARKRAVDEAMGILDSVDAAESLVQKITSDDRRTSRLARQLISMVPPSNLVSQLIEVFREDSRQLRARAYQMLRLMGSKALPALHGRLEDMMSAGSTIRDNETGRLVDWEWFAARNVIQVLRDIGSRSSIAVIRKLSSDPDFRIRKECLMAVSRMAPRTAEEMAAAMLRDLHMEVARIALHLLAKGAGAREELVGQIIKGFGRSPELDGEVVRTLSGIAGIESARRFLAKSLTGYQSGVPYLNRDAAFRALSALERHGEVSELHTLQPWYRKVSGGLFRRAKVDRKVLAACEDAMAAIRDRYE